MSSKEQTPAVSDAAKSSSPSKAENEKPLFTAKEEHLLKVAMIHCLKSGPPEIDYQKFIKYGEFNTLKTAQNTWGKIKQKLNQAAGPKDESEEGGDGSTTPKTPKAKGTPTPKKRASPTKKAVDGDDAEALNGDADPKTPKATQKKRTSPKNADVDVKVADGEDTAATEEGSPPKKPRKSPAKKAPVTKEEATKDEDEVMEEVAVKAEGDEE